MTKALFISSRPIYPIIGGDQIRTEQQLEFLSEKFDVDVVFITNNPQPDLDRYSKYSKNVLFFYRPKIKCIIGTMKSLFNSLPLQVNYYNDRRVRKYVEANWAKYDLIFCNNIRTAEFAIRIHNVRKVMDFVDAISMNYDKARKRASGLMKIIYNIDFHRCRKYEQTVLNMFDACSIISPIDKEYIQSYTR